MSFLEQFERRLGRSDMIQLLTLFLVVLAFMTLARWANPLSRVNEAWFSVSQTRVILLALIALGYGGAYALRPRPAQRSTGLAVLMFALVSTPFEVAAYAASYPSVPPRLGAPPPPGRHRRLLRYRPRARLVPRQGPEPEPPPASYTRPADRDGRPRYPPGGEPPQPDDGECEPRLAARRDHDRHRLPHHSPAGPRPRERSEPMIGQSRRQQPQSPSSRQADVRPRAPHQDGGQAPPAPPDDGLQRRGSAQLCRRLARRTQPPRPRPPHGRRPSQRASSTPSAACPSGRSAGSPTGSASAMRRPWSSRVETTLTASPRRSTTARPDWYATSPPPQPRLVAAHTRPGARPAAPPGDQPGPVRRVVPPGPPHDRADRRTRVGSGGIRGSSAAR